MFSSLVQKLRPRWGRYSVADMTSEFEENSMVSFLSLTNLTGRFDSSNVYMKMPPELDLNPKPNKPNKSTRRPHSCIDIVITDDDTCGLKNSFVQNKTQRPLSCMFSSDYELSPYFKHNLMYYKKHQDPLSTVSQLSGLACGASSGYSSASMSGSQDSLSSLARNDSIQRRLHNISRRRRQQNALKRKRLCESIISSDSVLEESESYEKENEDILTTLLPTSLVDTRPRSMNFDDLRVVGISDDDDVISENRNVRVRPMSVHFDNDDGHDADIEENDSENNQGSPVTRQKSLQLKSWEIRRHRRAIGNMKKRASRLIEKENDPPFII